MKTVLDCISEDNPKGDMPCMRLLSVKILVRCWEKEYADAFMSLSDRSVQECTPSSKELCEFTRATARRNVAAEVMVLFLQHSHGNEDLFLPLLEMRCHKEMGSLRVKVGNMHSGTECDYYGSELSAWEGLVHAISN